MPIWLIVILAVLVLGGGSVAVASGAAITPSESNPANWLYWLKKAQQGQSKKKLAYIDAWKNSGMTEFVRGLGVPALAWAAICAWESGWGTSYAARVYNNLTGISYKDKWTGIMRPYRYASLGEYRVGLTKLLELSRYAKAKDMTDPVQHVIEMGKAGYNTSATWREGVVTLVKELQHLNIG